MTNGKGPDYECHLCGAKVHFKEETKKANGVITRTYLHQTNTHIIEIKVTLRKFNIKLPMHQDFGIAIPMAPDIYAMTSQPELDWNMMHKQERQAFR